MNQNCVPTWNNNLEDACHSIPLRSPPSPPLPSFTTHPYPASPSAGLSDTSTLDYEMAELGWENGQLTMHGLGLPRVPSKSNVADTRANGTLESIVNQAYCHSNREPAHPAARVKSGYEHEDDDLVPWGPTVSQHVPVTLDALVPNNTTVGGSTRVGSCSAMAARVPKCSDWSASVSVNASESIRRKRQAKDTCEQMWSMNNNNNNGLASTSFTASLENTTTFTLDDHDSASQSRSQKEIGEEGENQKQGTTKSIGSAKRSRAAAVHNQSERKRRDKINQRMKTLQKLVPNSNKTDKASMLDEVIEYLKNLQAQVDMLSRMSVPSMMMPLAIQHQLQMSMMAPVGLRMGMGMGMDNLSNMGRPNMTGVSPSLMNMAAAYNMTLANCDNNGTPANGGAYNMPQGNLVSADPLSAYLACHSNPMTMDAYSKMAAIYQQQTQQHQPQQKQSYQQQPASVPSSNK